MTRFWKRLGACVTAAMVLAGASSAWADAVADRDLLWRYVREVLISPAHSRKFVVRWERPVRVALSLPTAETSALLDEAIGHLNEALAGTRFGLSRDDTAETPDIRVVIRPKAQLPAAARALDAKYKAGALGYFTCWWHRTGILYKCIVLVDEGLRGALRRAVALEELTQSLGLMNDQSVFRDSIVYTDPDDSRPVTALTARDRRLLRFLYTRVAPGDRMESLRGAFDRHWDDATLP